ncbi:hypothetical protein KUCAC02_026077 [Chaenocephalus aceratus]|uniref:Uncharacterized protein n=1 Tax=Chaenocephalus aceratus TaxID=36190 RepID=A0ACB9VWF3_CHAAC|nr:hypothetical protein KUCAC02_026077 [Chaenocephalus aceratus]
MYISEHLRQGNGPHPEKRCVTLPIQHLLMLRIPPNSFAWYSPPLTTSGREQHIDAGVPVMFSRCSASALTGTYLSCSNGSFSPSCTHSLSHCLVRDTSLAVQTRLVFHPASLAISQWLPPPPHQSKIIRRRRRPNSGPSKSSHKHKMRASIEPPSPPPGAHRPCRESKQTADGDSGVKSGQLSNERDYESVVMMKMRQAAERQKLIEQMQKEDDEEA